LVHGAGRSPQLTPLFCQQPAPLTQLFRRQHALSYSPCGSGRCADLSSLRERKSRGTADQVPRPLSRVPARQPPVGTEASPSPVQWIEALGFGESQSPSPGSLVRPGPDLLGARISSVCTRFGTQPTLGDPRLDERNVLPPSELRFLFKVIRTPCGSVHLHSLIGRLGLFHCGPLERLCSGGPLVTTPTSTTGSAGTSMGVCAGKRGLKAVLKAGTL
jgi:hypothetical protein